jgi:uncharacterized protein YndB with AHSA1/START domain
MSTGRTDTASRTIRATPRAVYSALVDPQALVLWLPPAGMSGNMEKFDLREGGVYRMVLTYEDVDPRTAKSSDNTDVVEARFTVLLPGERVAQQIDFESDDPAFAGTMTMIWDLKPVAGGTQITITAQNVPHGISKQDHDAGLNSSLENLANYLE